MHEKNDEDEENSEPFVPPHPPPTNIAVHSAIQTSSVSVSSVSTNQLPTLPLSATLQLYDPSTFHSTMHLPPHLPPIPPPHIPTVASNTFSCCDNVHCTNSSKCCEEDKKLKHILIGVILYALSASAFALSAVFTQCK
jgi:hypothetical protein